VRRLAIKVTILNGNPDASNTEFDGYLADLTTQLESGGHQSSVLTLREMDIRYCIGCFGCWIKTPGECSNAADDSPRVCREYINADLVIFASPVIMGFTSAVLKRAHDRILPLLLPYMEAYHWEAHHVPRYERYPDTGLLLEAGPDTDAQDIQIITEIYQRDALNFKASFRFTRLTSDPVEEVAREINRL